RTFEEALSLLSGKVLDWSGGTNIGGALHQLHHRYPGLLSPGRTLFLLFSDGWDRGDSALLDSEMKNLKKQVKRLIWLNPLLGSPHYQPLCKGMAAALPYLDDFLPCHNLSSLKRLSHLLLRA
ncbi:MAG: VWA domain-containing protein, partial [Thermodesulfobacteriota bacterium]